MIENCDELEEAPFRRDSMKELVPHYCSFNKPISDRGVLFDEKTYEFHQKTGFIYSVNFYSRVDERFDVSRLSHDLFRRFIELLAPLTLNHFFKSSKNVYYSCLDVRGFEFQTMSVKNCKYSAIYPFSGSEGRSGLHNNLTDFNFDHYRICCAHLHVDLCRLAHFSLRFNFVKRYKSLVVNNYVAYDTDTVVKSLFHPGIEHVNFRLCYVDETLNIKCSNVITLEHLAWLLDTCKNVKTFYIHFDCDLMNNAHICLTLKDDPKMAVIQAMIENWAKKTSRLEVFFFNYKHQLFQLHKNKLKRLVECDGKWYFSDKCDIDANQYREYPHQVFIEEEFFRLPVYVRSAHYDLLMKELGLADG